MRIIRVAGFIIVVVAVLVGSAIVALPLHARPGGDIAIGGILIVEAGIALVKGMLMFVDQAPSELTSRGSLF